MAYQTIPSSPFDVLNITGPTRAISPVITRGGAVVLDTHYGEVAKGLWVGTTGNVSVILPSGNSLAFNSVPVGFLWVANIAVNTTGTTASNIVWVS